MKNKKKYYFDYASATPIDKRVLKVLFEESKKNYANASSLYTKGILSKKSLEDSRKSVATILGIKSKEVVFTAGGTESINIAILGIYKSAVNNGIKNSHFITSSIEHSAVLETFKEIEKMGGKVSYVNPEKNGIIDPLKVKKEINDKTILVSIMYVNNEIGTIQPIREIFKVIKEYKYKNRVKYPYFHTDASQGVEYLTLHLESLGIDLMSLDGSKIYGPKSTGILFIKENVDIEPVIFGGGQERGIRPGTENVPAIVAFSEALKISQKMRENESERVSKMRDFFIKEILDNIPNSSLNGALENRLPNNANICFPGLDSEFAIIKLDELGFCVSSSSSCRNLSDDNSSYVINVINGNKCSSSSLRFTFGRETKLKDVKKLIKAVVSSCG